MIHLHLRPSAFICGWASPIQLQYFPWWVALLAMGLGGAFVVLLGVRSLSGLGPVRKWVAIGVRLTVLLLFILILGGVRWTRQHKDVEIIVIQDASPSILNLREWPGKNARNEKEYRTLRQAIESYYRGLAQDPTKEAGDRIGMISFKESAKVDAMPNRELRVDARGIDAPGTGTDIASGIQLALATMSPDAMHRFVLMSDFVPTSGDTDAAIAAAVAQGVPIDVVPMRYDIQNDVMIERFVAPSWKRENEPFLLSVVLRSTNGVPVKGRLRVIHQTRDSNLDLDMDLTTPGLQKEREVVLKPGLNSEQVKVPPLGEGGVHRFKTIFTPEKPGTGGVTVQGQGGPGGGPGGGAGPGAGPGPASVDAVEDNNVGENFVFVRGKGRILYVDNTGTPDQVSPGMMLVKAMAEEGLLLEPRSIDGFPNSVVELQDYDAVVLNNVPRGSVISQEGRSAGLNDEQDRMLKTYVHEMGGGLVMIGGDMAFGAGGWQGSEVEKILPVDMEIPAQRQVGKGALVLVMHSCEMPQGNYWGEQCALKAVETLSSRDEVGIISYGMGMNNRQGIGGAQWDFPLAEKGDGSKVTQAIKRMQLGDMPSFDDTMNLALNGVNGQGGLIRSNARHKHLIMISDGDPAAPQKALMDAYKKAKITVSTVTVFPHTPGQQRPPVMDDVPNTLGGKAYGPIEKEKDAQQLPQIFIKEATLVKRSLIHEDPKGLPLTIRDGAHETVKGIADWQPVLGMVLTSRKNDPKVEMPISTGKMNDPVLAVWQTGLGRSAVWTSDAHARWGQGWAGSPAYSKLWAQIIRNVSRPPMSSDFDVRVTFEGGKGRVVVEALDKEGGAADFMTISGTVVGGPNLRSEPQQMRLAQTGPGRYEGEFNATEGAYVVALNHQGKDGKGGMIMGGGVLPSSPEKRSMKSNEALMERIRQATGGRVLEPFEPAGAELFSRDGLRPSRSPLPVWDVLIPFLLAMILMDVAVRRIAWDWNSTRRLAASAAARVRAFTVTRRVESAPTLDALKRVRGEVAETKFRTGDAGAAVGAGAASTAQGRGQQPPPPRPDPRAKFEARAGVEGDISKVVGGASNKPIPPPPKKIEPKGGAAAGGHMGGLMAAKKRAQQQIKDKETGEG